MRLPVGDKLFGNFMLSIGWQYYSHSYGVSLRWNKRPCGRLDGTPSPSMFYFLDILELRLLTVLDIVENRPIWKIRPGIHRVRQIERAPS